LLVDGGASINLVPYTMLHKIGKLDEDLTQTDMMLVHFEGNISPAQGAICVELTIGSKTLPIAFFIIKGRGSYNLLLGRDWIHANYCIPLQCTNASSNGSDIQWRWSKEKLP
jgi:hypothetical protein